MRLISSRPERPRASATTLLPSFAPAANDSGTFARPRYRVADANELVAGVVGHVAARAQPANVNIELALAPGRPVIEGDPAELAFAISGVLGAEVRSIDSGEGGTVRVELRADDHTISVLMTSDELPPLSCIRAIEPTSPGPDVDPTVAHCRRIVEAQGGRLELTETDGRIGFSIHFPRLPATTTVRVLPVRRAGNNEPVVAARLAS
jgi:hypothetical protein